MWQSIQVILSTKKVSRGRAQIFGSATDINQINWTIVLYRHQLINGLWDGSSERVTFINLTLKLAQYLSPLFSCQHRNWHFPFFSFNTSYILSCEGKGDLLSLESLIRLTHRSSFRNSLTPIAKMPFPKALGFAVKHPSSPHSSSLELQSFPGS